MAKEQKSANGGNGAHKRIPFDLTTVAETFDIRREASNTALETWLNALYTLNEHESYFFEQFYQRSRTKIDYWNEEELKIKSVGTLFLLADVEQPDQLEVFYERPLSAKVGEHQLAVIVDCVVAASSAFSTPRAPYFFLQEFKKAKGEKNDPEAQMLQAMLIAGALNEKGTETTVYGGYIVGSNWYFTTLRNRTYCSSRKFDATNREDLLQIVFILRKLKDLFQHRS